METAEERKKRLAREASKRYREKKKDERLLQNVQTSLSTTYLAPQPGPSHYPAQRNVHHQMDPALFATPQTVPSNYSVERHHQLDPSLFVSETPQPAPSILLPPAQPNYLFPLLFKILLKK